MLQVQSLAERGIPVTGTVVAKFRTGGDGGSRGRRISFTYTGPDGRSYRRAASLGIARWDECEVGGPIALYMLPDKPGTSAPAWLVDEARKVMPK